MIVDEKDRILPELLPLIAISVNIPNGEPVPATIPQKSGLTNLIE